MVFYSYETSLSNPGIFLKFSEMIIKSFKSISRSDDEYLLNIVFVGNDTHSKSTIIRKYASGKFDVSYLSIQGIDIMTKKITVVVKPIKLILIDTAGEPFFGKLHPSYYKKEQ